MARPTVYMTKSKHVKDGRVYEYAYLRYEAWDAAKGRPQPTNLASLGRTDQLDEWRTRSLADFLREWVRKDSSLPFEALRERFEAAEPGFRILCSREFGLRFIAEQAWRQLGYADAVANLHENPERARRIEIALFAIVVVQLVAPQSKRGALDWAGTDLFFPEAASLQLQDLYSAMDALAENYKAVERRLNDSLRALGSTAVEFAQDTTTIVCHVRYDDEERAEIEAERRASGEVVRRGIVNDPPIRMRGHSKAKRKDLPQVKVEAVIGNNGIIVHHSTPAGNTSDQALVGASVEALQQLGYKQVSWVSDAGFNSAANRDLLRAAKFEFVSSEGVSRSSVVDRVLSTAGRYAPHPTKPEVSFKCVRAEATEERTAGRPGRTRLYVVRRNENEESFALRTIARHLKRIEPILAKGGKEAEKLLHHPTYKRYVRRDARTRDERGRPAGPPILDREAVARAQSRAGKSVIATDDLEVDPLVVDDLYRQTADLERVFRDLKSAIEIGPIRHRRADRIEAHVMIAIMAHNLGAWIAHKTGMTIEAVRRLFSNLRAQEVECGDATYWERTELEPAQRTAILAMGFDLPPKRFTTTVLDGARSRSRRRAPKPG